MTFHEYLESRFIQSQLLLNKKKTTPEFAKNHAILAHMWICLKAMSAYHFGAVLIHYLGIKLGLIAPPRKAVDIASDARMAAAQAEIDTKKAAEEIVRKANDPAHHMVQ